VRPRPIIAQRHRAGIGGVFVIYRPGRGRKGLSSRGAGLDVRRTRGEFTNAIRFGGLPSGSNFFAGLQPPSRPVSSCRSSRQGLWIWLATPASTRFPAQACPAAWAMTSPFLRWFERLCCSRTCSPRGAPIPRSRATSHWPIQGGERETGLRPSPWSCRESLGRGCFWPEVPPEGLPQAEPEPARLRLRLLFPHYPMQQPSGKPIKIRSSFSGDAENGLGNRPPRRIDPTIAQRFSDRLFRNGAGRHQQRVRYLR
jgi:hypothetical protein